MIAAVTHCRSGGHRVDVGELVAAALGAIFGGGGTAAVVTAITRRRLTRVEAADRLADTAIELLETVKRDTREDLVAMREEVAGARQEAAQLRSSLRAATTQAEMLGSYLTRVMGAIHDPTMTMERLRVLVGSGPPNGNVGLWVSHHD